MKQFLPFLTDDLGRSLDVDNGVVVTRSLPDALTNSPEGWENNTLQYARNNEFRSVIQAYTTNLKFYLDGATILRDAFYRLGMEVTLFFIWLKLDSSFGADLVYKGWYKGEPDWSTFKDFYADNSVTINIAEGGFFKDLQANKTVQQDIPFDEDTSMLYVDGVNLRQKLNYTDVEDQEVALSLYGENFFGPYILVSQDGASTGFVINSQQLEEAPAIYADKLTSLNSIITNAGSVPIDINITGTIEFINTAMTSSPAYAVRFRFLKTGLPIGDQNLYEIYSTPAMVIGQTYSQDFDITITLNPNESLYREGIFFGGPGTEAVIKFTANSRSSINFITRQVPAVIQTYRVYDLGRKLMARISIGAQLESPLLEPDFNLLVTSGDAIRSLPEAVIKTTVSDYLKSVDAVKCISLAIEENTPIIYDRYEKFNRTSIISDLGQCSDWQLEPANDYMYDVVNVGYVAKDADSNIDVNGRYSFNNTFTWKINATRRGAVAYDAVSKYFADPYDITLIRVNLKNKTTTTGSTDNSNFFIDAEEKTDISFTGDIHFDGTDNKIEFTGDSTINKFFAVGAKFAVTGSVSNNKTFRISAVDVTQFDLSLTVDQLVTDEDVAATLTATNLYQLRRPTFDNIEGIPGDGTEFNLLITPGRNLKRHLRWLHSSFDHMEGNSLIFQTTQKNRTLLTELAGVIVDEDADIPVSTMGDKVFLPYYTNFEIKSPYNLKELLDTNNSGIFIYQCGSIGMDGFIVDIKTQDAYLETQNYKLLMSANNDNLRLINQRG